jgi:cobalt/nickel transport system permease protein
MHASTFDRYQARDSAIHHLDPRVQVVVTIVFIVGIALLPDAAWTAYALAFALVMVTTLLARLSPLAIIGRSLLGLPFLLVAVTVIFTVPGEVVWVGPFGLEATAEGLVRFGSIIFRSLISLQAAVLMTSTIPFPDILHALRHLRVPAILVSILAFMYRYLFVLADEVTRLLRARTARSAAPVGQSGGRSVAWRARVVGGMAGQLLVRSLDRSDRVYNAMLSRGYRGELLTLRSHTMHGRDWAALAIGLVAVIALQLMAR